MVSGLGVVEELLEKQSTGEVVGASGTLEVHAWLQHGRIAWATSSRAPRTFRQYLTTVCNVPDAHLSEIFAACRAARRPLGEELVTLGVASREQVIDALRQQIATALLDFDLLEATQVVLLPRQWGPHEHAFTFAFDDVVKRSTALTPLPFAPRAAQLVEQLTAHLPMLQWAVHTDGARLTAERPSGCAATAAEVSALHGKTIARGAQLVLLRRPDNLLLGAQTREGSVWGALSLAGPITRALAAFSRGLPSPAERAPRPGPGLVRSPGADGLSDDDLSRARSRCCAGAPASRAKGSRPSGSSRSPRASATCRRATSRCACGRAGGSARATRPGC